MSAHARRYSRIRERRTAKAYAPKHRVGDQPESDHPKWLATGIALLVLSINLYVGAGLYNNSHDLPGDFGDETSQP